MKTNPTFAIYLLMAASIAISCDTVEPSPPPPTLPDRQQEIDTGPILQPWEPEEGIYIAGMTYDSSRVFAQVWGDNHIPLNTNEVINSYASSVFLSGNDLYVAGYQDYLEGDCDTWFCLPYAAMLWKNGVAQPLTEANNSLALSVFVANGNVYMAGNQIFDDSLSAALLWINGVAQRLNDEKSSASASSVFVLNDDIYVAGYNENSEGGHATLWKNGVAERLSGGQFATAVFVSGSEVYVAGYGLQAMLWKNGVVQTLSSVSDFSSARSIYVSGEDVYVAGHKFTLGSDGSHGPEQPLVWKNGLLIPPANDDQYATINSISVSGEDVYTVGQTGGMAVIWKNGKAKSLGKGSATGLFVKK